METPAEDQLFPEFKNEDVIGVIKYVGEREEFIKFAKDMALRIYDFKIPVDPEKHPQLDLFRWNTKMVILGTVNGVVRNEIIFVKDKVKKDGESENAEPVS
jgi:hypothetical protein